MHCITLLVGPQGTAWTYLFKTKESAETAFTNMLVVKDLDAVAMNAVHLLHQPGAILHITDDFGQAASIPAVDFHGCQLENLDETKLAHVERALHNARTQAEANTRAGNDPALKAAATMAQMSGRAPMYQPNINGR